MNQVVIDQALRERLNGLNEQLAFWDESGKPLGLFLPVDEYKKLLASVEVPFSQEEINSLRRAEGGSSLAEFWKRMGRT